MTTDNSTDWSSLIAIFLALSAIVLVIIGWGNQKFVLQESNQDTLSVTGESEMTVDPNKSELYLKIETRNQNAQKAQEENRKKSDRVRQSLSDAGVMAEEIETTQFNLQRIEEYNREERTREFKGYKQIHVMKITTEDLEKVGKYIDASVEAGANGIDQIIFDLTEKKKQEIRNEVLKMASGEAKSKAQSMANSLGVNIGNPVRINESRFNFSPHRSNMQSARMKMESSDAPGTQVSPEKVTVTASVNVDYRIN